MYVSERNRGVMTSPQLCRLVPFTDFERGLHAGARRISFAQVFKEVGLERGLLDGEPGVLVYDTLSLPHRKLLKEYSTTNVKIQLRKVSSFHRERRSRSSLMAVE